uniref:Uncharacterized protein n=1 Tax=Oryza rufipogon TaxID=4529 RepID=A0A0E0PMY7_ORYRU
MGKLRRWLGKTSPLVQCAAAAEGDDDVRRVRRRRRIRVTAISAASQDSGDGDLGGGFAGGGGRGKDERRGASSGQRDGDDGGRAMIAAVPDLEESVAVAICGGVCGRSAGGEGLGADVEQPSAGGEGCGRLGMGRKEDEGDARTTDRRRRRLIRRGSRQWSRGRWERGERSAGSERCGSDMSHWIRQSGGSYSGAMRAQMVGATWSVDPAGRILGKYSTLDR